MGFKSPQQASMSAGQLALYGLDGPTLDNLDDVEDLAAAMGELEGLHVTVSCKAKRDGDGVWTNITGSRTGKSDVPADQAAFSLGDNRKDAQPARRRSSATTSRSRSRAAHQARAETPQGGSVMLTART
jgi:hypothetical protein